MVTCKNCFHYEACSGFKPTDLDKDVWHYCQMGIPEEIPDIDQRCDSFKNRKSWVEVVRCKDCKHAGINENHPNKPLICYLTRMCGTVKPDWYCWQGERKDNGKDNN